MGRADATFVSARANSAISMRFGRRIANFENAIAIAGKYAAASRAHPRKRRDADLRHARTEYGLYYLTLENLRRTAE